MREGGRSRSSVTFATTGECVEAVGGVRAYSNRFGIDPFLGQGRSNHVVSVCFLAGEKILPSLSQGSGRKALD